MVASAGAAVRAVGYGATLPEGVPEDSSGVAGPRVSRPTKETAAGRAYLGLRSKAKAAGRPMAEYLRLYALEGFLLRLSQSEHRERLVLKGGVLLAAHDLRRPTTDIDVAALRTPGDAGEIRRIVVEVASTSLPDSLDDGLVFDLTNVSAEVIREEDEYSGVRVRLVARLASAREPFHVDVNVGDPIWPEPAEIRLPRLLDGDPIALRGYPLELSIAEKVVTAIQPGVASTRWRDFGDVYLVSLNAVLRGKAVAGVDRDRVRSPQGDPRPLRQTPCRGYPAIGQSGWSAWRARLNLEESLPESFAETLAAVFAFVDPILSADAGHRTAWDPETLSWS